MLLTDELTIQALIHTASLALYLMMEETAEPGRTHQSQVTQLTHFVTSVFLRSNKIMWISWCALCLVKRSLFKLREPGNLCLSPERLIRQKTLTILKSLCNTSVDFNLQGKKYKSVLYRCLGLKCSGTFFSENKIVHNKAS